MGGRYVSLRGSDAFEWRDMFSNAEMIRDNAESKKELEQWDVEFDSKLLRMGERVLLDEEMVQKRKISHKGRLRTR